MFMKYMFSLCKKTRVLFQILYHISNLRLISQSKSRCDVAHIVRVCDWTNGVFSLLSFHRSRFLLANACYVSFLRDHFLWGNLNIYDIKNIHLMHSCWNMQWKSQNEQIKEAIQGREVHCRQTLYMWNSLFWNISNTELNCFGSTS